MELASVISETQDIINNFRNEVIHTYTAGRYIENIDEIAEALAGYVNPEIDRVVNAIERQRSIRVAFAQIRNVYEFMNNKSNTKLDRDNIK